MKVHSLLFMMLSSVMFITAITSCNKEQYNYLEKTKTGAEIENTDNKLEKVYNMCLGLFSNKVQARAETSPLYRSQELISVPIWPKRGGEYCMYICWLQENRPEDLLSQEVWNFQKKDRETIQVTMYDLPNKSNYTSDWRKKDPLGNLKPADLILRDGCTASITRISTNEFKLEGTPCARNLSDVIKHVEVHGKLMPDSVILYNVMLNRGKKEIFGYKKGLKFERQPKIFPKYLEDDEDE